MYYQTLLEDLEQQTTNHKIVKLPKHVTDTHQPGNGLLPENGGDGIWQTHGAFRHDWFYCPLKIFFHPCKDLSGRSGDFVGCKGQADRTELVVLVCGTDKAYWHSSSLSTDRPWVMSSIIPLLLGWSILDDLVYTIFHTLHWFCKKGGDRFEQFFLLPFLLLLLLLDLVLRRLWLGWQRLLLHFLVLGRVLLWQRLLLLIPVLGRLRQGWNILIVILKWIFSRYVD